MAENSKFILCHYHLYTSSCCSVLVLIKIKKYSVVQPQSARLTLLTVCVLKTETGFVSLGHFGPVGVQQIVVGEDVHAVVVTVENREGGVNIC